MAIYLDPQKQFVIERFVRLGESVIKGPTVLACNVCIYKYIQPRDRGRCANAYHGCTKA